MKRTTITPQFVNLIPKDLEEGVLYISSKYATATHRCLCGCGTKIVTPLKPGFWKLTVHDEDVSLHPSVGNWNQPCQSHYVIARDAVWWVGAMSKAQIARGRARDDAWVNQHYGAVKATRVEPPSERAVPGEALEEASTHAGEPRGASAFVWARIWRWLSR